MSAKNFSKSAVLVQIFIIGVLIVPGFAIKCYICDSSKNPGCTDLKANSGIEPEQCEPSKMNKIDSWLMKLNQISYLPLNADIPEYNVPMQCQKVVATTDGNPVTARFCQITTAETDPCSIPMAKVREDRSIKIVHCSVCNTDMCNSAPKEIVSIFSLTAISSIIYMLKFFF